MGWSAGDVAAGVELLVRVGKALKESSGSKTEYQDAVEFLESVSRLIASLSNIRNNNPQLKWEDGLVTPSNTVMSVIKSFKGKTKLDKYDKSLGSNSGRNKMQTILREIQFELSSVKKLKSEISQPLVVLNNFLNLQTL